MQLEQTATASRYNLVENRDFSYAGTTEQEPYGWQQGSGCAAADKRVTSSIEAAPQLDVHVYTITGNTGLNKRLYQDVRVSGAKGDVLTAAGWARADSAPISKVGRKMSIIFRFYYTDGTSADKYVCPAMKSSCQQRKISYQMKQLTLITIPSKYSIVVSPLSISLKMSTYETFLYDKGFVFR